MALFFGVDIGGTSVKTAFVDDTGRILHHSEFPTDPETGIDDFLKRLNDTFVSEADKAGIAQGDVAGVGAGVPGFLDDEQGMVVEAVNLGWKMIPLRQKLEDLFGVPVAVENDANVAALGESWAGAGRGKKNLVCVTVGTGIGAGIVLDGHLYRGTNGMAGEIGHLTVVKHGGLPCNCGKSGCLETVASATAIIREGSLRIQHAGDIEGAAEVFEFAEQGNEQAHEVIADAADWLGYGLALVATAINPDGIVIGGGVSNAHELFIKPVKAAFDKYALERVQIAEVVAAKLGNEAGVVGAARLVQQRMAHQR